VSSQPPIPPRPDGLHPVPVMPPRPDTTGATGDARPKATWSWYEALVVYIVAFLVAGLATLPVLRLMEPEDDLTNIVVTIIAALVIMGVLLLWLSTYHKGWLGVMRLPERGTWGREIGSAVLFGLGLYPVIVIVVGGLLTYLLQTISGERVEAPEQVGEHLPAIGTALTIVYAVVIAPIGEELFFRGVLFRTLRDRHGFWVGAVGSAVRFGDRRCPAHARDVPHRHRPVLPLRAARDDRGPARHPRDVQRDRHRADPRVAVGRTDGAVPER
jgi:membrane protease YdiL (CAAX protease family)